MKTLKSFKKDIEYYRGARRHELSVPLGYSDGDVLTYLSTCDCDLYGSVLIAGRNQDVLISYAKSVLLAARSFNTNVSVDNVFYSNNGERDREIVREGKFGDPEIELNTYREVAAFINGIRMDIGRRIYNINMLGCRTWYEYNDAVKSLAGRRMTAEQQWCFNNRSTTNQYIIWDNDMAILPSIYALNDVLDYMENPAFSSVLVSSIDYILKHAGAAGVCFIMTVSELSRVPEYLKSSFYYNVLVDESVHKDEECSYITAVFQTLAGNKKAAVANMPV